MRAALGVVLRLRQRREEEARRELLVVRQEADAIHGRLRTIDETTARRNRWARAAIAQDCNESFAPYRRLISTARAQALHEMKQLSIAQAAVLEKRAALLDALKRRKTIQRLIERMDAAEQATQQRRRAGELDDLYLAHRQVQQLQSEPMEVPQ